MRVALALTIAASLALGAGAAPAPAQTRRCGQLNVDLGTADEPAEGSAVDIRATRVSCERARSVARACVRNTIRGWRVRFVEGRGQRPDRFVLERGDARVSFSPAGGGGCFPER
jgi:hypothetical protein